MIVRTHGDFIVLSYRETMPAPDLSATFKTVDHNVLLDHKFRRLGIQDTSLFWVPIIFVFE